MTGPPEVARALAGILALSALSACVAPDPTSAGKDPGAVALQLFALAAAEPPPEGLPELFDPDALSDGTVSLLEALDSLADSPPPELVAVHSLEGSGEAFADLAVELPGEGLASYCVQLRRLGTEGWRVAWFQGPGVEWPSRRRRGESLSTSSPPEPRPTAW